MLKNVLTHPLARGTSLDLPETTVLRRRIIKEKRFLRRIYEHWYAMLAAAIPPGEGEVLELGAGAGFFKETFPECLNSEIFFMPGMDIICDGCRLPLTDASLRALVMTDVLHHLPRVEDFFREMDRCVRPGGVVAMVEPWVTPWSRIIFSRLHHEPFLPETPHWHFESSGPLSGANGALPWIVFVRDRKRFFSLCPGWRVERIHLMMPLRYLLSGGVSLRSLAPAWSYEFWAGLESCLAPVMRHIAMFACIVLRKADLMETVKTCLQNPQETSRLQAGRQKSGRGPCCG